MQTIVSAVASLSKTQSTEDNEIQVSYFFILFKFLYFNTCCDVHMLIQCFANAIHKRVTRSGNFLFIVCLLFAANKCLSSLIIKNS